MSFQITVRIPGAAPRTVPLEGEFTIGRIEGNDLVLEQPRVSKRHARVSMVDGRCRIEDLGSTNGTTVAGERIEGRRPLEVGEIVVIGGAELELTRVPPLQSEAFEATGGADPALRKEMHDRLIAALDLRRLDLDRLDATALRSRSEEALRTIVAELEKQGRVPPGVDRERLLVDVADEVLGLGPLEALLADDEVSEIMVNHSEQIFVERNGRIVPSGKTFSSNRAVLGVIERIVAPIGRRIDEASPLVDARLADGSRVHAIIPPLALKGPCITIRKFKREKLQAPDLVRFGSLTEPMAAFLELAVRARKNVVISGGTGSGKTTLLNVLTSFIPPTERIVTVEDAAELQIRQPHWVQLEARPPNLEGHGAITVRELVKNCLRMRPDRIIVGECRSGEALDMLQAMNTGHDGSLTTLHANTPRDALARLETMCLMSGMDLPVRAIREQVCSAVDLIVQQTRFPDGTRRVTHVAEVSGMEGEVITLQEIFRFEQKGFDAEGRVLGLHRAAGLVPRFCEELSRRGIAVDLSVFREER